MKEIVSKNKSVIKKFFLILLLLASCVCFGKNKIILHPGDVLKIDFPGESKFNKTFEINEKGEVDLPEVGETYIAGDNYEKAKEKLLSALSMIYKNNQSISISLVKRQKIIYVRGYVKKPGVVRLDYQADLQSAIEAAGGLKPGAKINQVKLINSDGKKNIDYKKYLITGDSTILPKMRSLDEVFVPSIKLPGNAHVDYDKDFILKPGGTEGTSSSIKIFGEVHKPGSYSFIKDATVIDYLLKSGGVTRYAGVDQIRVVNKNKATLLNLKKYFDSGEKSLLPKIQKSAIIFIPQEVEEVKSGSRTVYVMGEVQKPGAYEMNKKLSFIDVLANAGGPNRYSEIRKIKLIRANGEVINFDLQAYTEGIRKQASPDIIPGDTILVPQKTDMNEKSWLNISPNKSVKIIGAIKKPGRYEWSDEMNLLDLLSHAEGPTSKADIAHIRIISSDHDNVVNFDFEKYMMQGGNFNKIPNISSGMTVVVPELPVSPNDNKALWSRLPAESAIYIFGQVHRPGRYAFHNGLGFLDIVSASDGPTQDADLQNVKVIHRHSMKPSIENINLALYFQTGDDTLLPHVLPGDSIYVPSSSNVWMDNSPSETVRVIGDIKKPGIYPFTNKMTILDLLAGAGGPTNDANNSKILIISTMNILSHARKFNLEKYSQTGDPDLVPVLQPGDTVYVPDRHSSIRYRFMEGVKDIFLLLGTYRLATNSSY